MKWGFKNMKDYLMKALLESGVSELIPEFVTKISVIGIREESSCGRIVGYDNNVCILIVRKLFGLIGRSLARIRRSTWALSEALVILGTIS